MSACSWLFLNVGGDVDHCLLTWIRDLVFSSIQMKYWNMFANIARWPGQIVTYYVGLVNGFPLISPSAFGMEGSMSIYDVRSQTTGITSNVKRIMEEKKISIVALSNETKLSTKIIERARTSKIKLCKLETLAIIAKGLNVKIVDLFNE